MEAIAQPTKQLIIEAANLMRQAIEQKEWLTGTEAMELLGCEKSTLYKYTNGGKITYSQMSGRHRLYSRRSLVRFIESKTIKSIK